MKTTVFDEEKTKELLKEVESADVTTVGNADSVAKILQKSVVEVRLTSGKGNFKSSITMKDLGLDLSDEESKKFAKEYLETGIYYFPKNIEKDINNISSRLRRYIERAAIATGINGYYINKDDYKKIKSQFGSAKSDFFKKRDELISNYDTYYETFKERVKKLYLKLSEMSGYEEDEIDESMMDKVTAPLIARFPLKAELEKSFYMELIVQPYPVLVETEVEDHFDKELFDEAKDGYATNAVTTFYQIVGTILNNLFGRIHGTMLTFCDNGAIPNKTKGGIVSAIKAAINDNTIVKNEKISKILKVMKRTLVDGYSIDTEGGTLDPITNNEMIESCEMLMGNIYGYAKYLNIQHMIQIPESSDYTADDLYEIYKFGKSLDELVDSLESK